MSRNTDILFMTEYIQNVLYFATVRQGKILKNTADTHYFCVDDELIYENYYSDFGPLNIGCVYRYCKILNEKLKLYLNKQCIVHYTSIDPKKKANAAFLLGCYGVLYLSLTPKDALKPLIVYGQSYRPFQDATQGDSAYTISLMDCLQGLSKAHDLCFFNFQDFNYDDYERLDKIQGGDLNWIVPGKFLAFIGPVDYSVSLYHPPEMYIEYFQENDVKIVIRLNKKFYDGNVFINAGITHYNLFFPDGSCPPRHILLKFLQISEESEGAIAVHCKAGLGRTGSLIGCYLIKHYRMTAHEAIAWMRICRPGSVIGHQQGWLEQLEPWLMKQGNLYRKRNFNDIDNLPIHEYGIYSKTKKTHKQRPVVFSKSPSPPPPINRQIRSEISTPPRPQASKAQEISEIDEEEIFIAECDLTVKPTEPMTQMKGCIIKNTTIKEEYHSEDSEVNAMSWKQYLCCKPCAKACNDKLWMLAVRCAKITPNNCCINKCCLLLDMAASSKTTEKTEYEWKEKMKTSPKVTQRGISREWHGIAPRNITGAGEPRTYRSQSRHTTKTQERVLVKSNDPQDKNFSGRYQVPTFHTSQAPIAKTLNDARNILLRSSVHNEERAKQLNSSIIVKSQYPFRIANTYENVVPGNVTNLNSSTFNAASKFPMQSQQRRRLGRSPSPPARMVVEQSRATNTPKTSETLKIKESKSNIKEALSRLKLSAPRDGSIGAASLGARRDAPTERRRAPSVRSDERQLATQGDMLNSIKFQRGLREAITAERQANKLSDKSSSVTREKSSIRNTNSRTSSITLKSVPFNLEVRDRTTPTTTRRFSTIPRPSSPKGRRSPHPSFY